MKEEKTLASKLLNIQQELKAPKNQKNTFGGYNYRSCEDILEAVKPLLKKENYAKGVVIKYEDEGLQIDVYVVISYGIKISEVVGTLQQSVKYALEKTLNMDVASVNVHVEGIRINE